MNTVSKNKTLLSCLLAACMGLSAFAGGMLLKADAATDPVAPSALFTASQGVNVLPASQYEKADGSLVGDTGLRFQSPTDEAFTIELNGVFDRSFGLEWSAPADGWIAGSEVVFEIAEFGNPENKFEIHYYSKNYQSGAWVEYDYKDSNGDPQTLYRTYGLNYQNTSRMVYSKDIIDESLSDVDTSDLLYQPSLTLSSENVKSRTAIRVHKSASDNWTATTADEGAIISVAGIYKQGSTSTIASFCDDPAKFVPTDKDTEVYAEVQWANPSGDTNYEVGYNLPRINFANGYTIKIHVSAGLEFMAYNVAEAFADGWTSDPWYAFGTQDGSYPVQQYDITGATATNTSNVGTDWADKNVTPLFYQNWQAIPFIAVSDYNEYVAAGQVITPPQATYATNGAPNEAQEVTDVQYRINGGDWSAVPDGGIPARDLGDDVEVRYTATEEGKTITEVITLRVRSKAAELVTATNGATVTAAKSYTTTAGDYTTPAGLYIAAPSDKSLSYGVGLNGIFTGSTGIKAYFPGEGFWEATRETVITVASAVDPEEKFQVHIGGRYQSYGYVTYDWNGQTLYRTINSYANNSTYYYREDNVKDVGAAQYLPVQGHMSDTDLGRREPYIGFEMQADGTFNVVLISSHNAGVRKTIASFCEERKTFTPTTEASGTAPNLPKLDLSKGYTISIENSDNDDTKSFDLLIESIATSKTGDPYAEGNGTVHTLNGAWVEEVPAFYTAWLAFPSITVPEHEEIIEAGEDYTAPAATYATNGNPSAANPVDKIEYRVDGGNWVSTTDGVIPGSALKAGVEVEVRYTVGDVSKIITLSVRNKVETGDDSQAEYITKNIAKTSEGVTVTPQTTTSSITGEGQTNTSSDKGLLFSSASAYSFDLVGRFEGDTTITWSTAADNDWEVQNRQVEFIVADATDPENYFKVVWRSPYQSAAYVEYVYHGTTLYCARADVTDNTKCLSLPMIGQASSSGILGLRWSGDVLNVIVKKEDGNEQVLASFENDPEDFEPATSGTGDKSNLPKISFENGYTISVNVTTHSGAAARSATAVRSMKAARTAASEPRFLDFLLQKVETKVDTISFNEDITVEPAWSTEGQKIPTIDPLAKLPGMQLGENTTITVPELNYTKGTADVTLSITWIKPDGTKTFGNKAGDELDLSAQGDHTLLYTVTADGIGYTREITIHVCDYKTYVSGTPATCVATGLGTYECAHQKTMDKILPIDPSAHDYRANWTWNGATPSVEFECRDCDKTTQSTGEITVTEIGGVDSTCLTEGKKKLQASVIFGGYRYINSHEVVVPVSGHTLTAIEEKQATCTEAGNKACWMCSVCGKFFLDAEGGKEAGLDEITTPVEGHQMKQIAEKAATCTEAGNKAYWECTVCGKLFLDAEGKTETTLEAVALPATGHHMVQVPAKAPTCTENGNSAYYKCSGCGRCSSDDKGEMEIDESSMILKAKGHTFENGVCTVCGTEDPGIAVSGEGLTGGQIAAIVVVAVVVAAGIAVAVVLVVRKKRSGGQK